MIESYLYNQYADDPDLPIFVDRYNYEAWAALEMIRAAFLPLYSDKKGAMLDYIAYNVYGILRPTGATDAIFIRILNWNLSLKYLGRFNVDVLKRKIVEFTGLDRSVISVSLYANSATISLPAGVWSSRFRTYFFESHVLNRPEYNWGVTIYTSTKNTAAGSALWKDAALSNDGSIIYVGSSTGLKYSTDGGATWSALGGTLSVYKMAANSSGILANASMTNSASLYGTYNTGGALTSVVGNTQNQPVAVASDGNNIACCTTSTIRLSFNVPANTSGTSKNVTAYPAGTATGCCIADGGLKIGVCTNGSGVYYSTDGGTTFTSSSVYVSLQLQGINAWKDIACAQTGSRMIAVSTLSNQVFLSNNGGASFYNLTASIAATYIGCAISYDGTIITVWTSTQIFRSTDSGATWSAVPFSSSSIAFVSVSGNGSRIVTADTAAGYLTVIDL